MLNTMMENENTKFIFHHSIQHDQASGYTFCNEVGCPNQYI